MLHAVEQVDATARVVAEAEDRSHLGAQVLVARIERRVAPGQLGGLCQVSLGERRVQGVQPQLPLGVLVGTRQQVRRSPRSSASRPGSGTPIAGPS
ncbi:MAG: hypothetical protein WKG00_29895 [Polyangiaceae bacterium]